MASEPITSGSSALSPRTSADATPEIEQFLAAEKPDTEFLPSTARMSRAELDALPSAQNLDPLGIGVLAGAANVIMQLSLPAVGYGVYESRVDSGNLFKHPLKRGRTTLSYLAVAGLGSAKDRKAYRKAIGKATRRSGPPPTARSNTTPSTRSCSCGSRPACTAAPRTSIGSSAG